MGKRKILLADDEEDIKTVVKLYLESKGYDVVTAYDGLDTLDKAKAEQPDLILLDIMMPVINGFEVCKQLKADDKTSHIPVVMLSAASHADSVERAMEAGALDYIMKPFEPPRVEVIIKKILG
jgi:DNA-binding response OmpR family regulator